MRLLFVADGRSPIALNWIRYFCESGHEVHLASSFACTPDLPLASYHSLPVAMSELRAPGVSSAGTARPAWQKLFPVRARTALRQWVGPFTIPAAARRLAELVGRLEPDLVHAMRIPYEGMLAAKGVPSRYPLLVSVWGNDFTLHARSNPWMAHYTRQTLGRADAVHTDCRRDARLSHDWGYPAGKPHLVLPGGGGVQLDVFYPAGEQIEPRRDMTPVVIQPRGLRAYVRNDTFFKAIPIVLERFPQTRFVCTTMLGEPEAERWIAALGIADSVDLLPLQTRAQMAELFRRAWVAVSPTTHDGTPNTLLEAMACGCFPVVGDIEPLREWIVPGVNGLLVDPGDSVALAQAIISAVEQPELRAAAEKYNTRLIQEKAEFKRVMNEAEGFYRSLIAW